MTTDANGYDTPCWLTTLAQVIQLNLNESPFFANYGLPDQQSVIQQVAPDYYVAQIQQQFSPYFASLTIAKVPDADNPTYNIAVLTPQGAKVVFQVPT